VTARKKSEAAHSEKERGKKNEAAGPGKKGSAGPVRQSSFSRNAESDRRPAGTGW
jgi:hypothetical protein